MIASINPATGKTLKTYQDHSEADVERIVNEAHAAFQTWRRTSFHDRGTAMRAAGAGLRKQLEVSARLMAEEMGKPLAQGRSELEKCAATCDFYADHAERFLSPEPVKTEAFKSYVAFEPLGVVLAIMPWNFPFWQVIRFAAPALMAGNAGILKHAGNVPGCALALEAIFRDAGFPPGLFRTVLIGSDRVAKLIPTTLNITLGTSLKESTELRELYRTTASGR